MSGYANRVVKLDFPDLSEDWATDPIWVVIRNPKTMDPKELASAYEGNTGFGDDGKVADREAAEHTTDKVIAKLVIAARAYDATVEPTIDPLTGEVTGNADQPLLPHAPWAPETAARLPQKIRTKISEKFTEAVNPQKAQEGSDTPRTSSGSPSPSTTEPGAEGQSQPS